MVVVVEPGRGRVPGLGVRRRGRGPGNGSTTHVAIAHSSASRAAMSSKSGRKPEDVRGDHEADLGAVGGDELGGGT